MLASLLFDHPLPLTFRWEELAPMAGAAVLAGATIADGRTRRWEGFALVGVYAALVVAYGFVGAR